MPLSRVAGTLAAVCDALPATHTIGLALPSVVVTRGEALRCLTVLPSALDGPPMLVHQFWVTLMGLPGVTVRPMRMAKPGSTAGVAGQPTYGPRSTVMAIWIPVAVVYITGEVRAEWFVGVVVTCRSMIWPPPVAAPSFELSRKYTCASFDSVTA